MPRPPRLHVIGGCYHAILRGNHREAIFSTTQDRRVLNDIVGDVLEHMNVRVHAFCWMTNHLHFLIQISERPLGDTMQRIAMRYSRYRHKRLQTTGHLFERRYGAKLVDVDAYFLTLLRYIHMNPVGAGLVADPFDYRWSSHRAYLGIDEIPWLTTSFGLSLFSARLRSARKAYQQFVLQSIGEKEDINDKTHADDSRVLGTDQFVSRLPQPANSPKSTLSLEQLAQMICTEYEIDINLLRSKSAARYLTPIRMQLLHRALQGRIATLTDVAQFLHRSPSTLARLSKRHLRKGQ